MQIETMAKTMSGDARGSPDGAALRDSTRVALTTARNTPLPGGFLAHEELGYRVT
ncbi:hypothetical protein [Burkholderia ubonensis]|uniref:hypothetical protein n=1 Tax=Burkholderia ubonensis TaxID=101571 RepID=UPI0015CC9F13|nr:hypothetical protein [Burkholderia ubonensis]